MLSRNLTPAAPCSTWPWPCPQGEGHRGMQPPGATEPGRHGQTTAPSRHRDQAAPCCGWRGAARTNPCRRRNVNKHGPRDTRDTAGSPPARDPWLPGSGMGSWAPKTDSHHLPVWSLGVNSAADRLPPAPASTNRRTPLHAVVSCSVFLKKHH